MHFPLFQISPIFSKNFRLCRKFNFSVFICQNFWWPFLVIDHRCRMPPYFPCFTTFPSVSRKCFFPLFSKNSPAFYILYVYFVSTLLWRWCIYASMHHPMHVLDASVLTYHVVPNKRRYNTIYCYVSVCSWHETSYAYLRLSLTTRGLQPCFPSYSFRGVILLTYLV